MGLVHSILLLWVGLLWLPEAPLKLDAITDEKHPFSPEVAALFDRAVREIEAQRPKEAETLLRQVIEKAPDNPRGHRTLGEAQMRLGRLEDAEASVSKSLTLGLDPTRRPYALLMRAGVRLELGRIAEGREDTDELLRVTYGTRDPLLRRAALELGVRLHLRVGSPERGLPLAREMVEREPRSAEAHSLLAATLAVGDHWDQARHHVRLARSLGGTNPVLDAIEEHGRRLGWFSLLWKLPLGLAVLLGVGLLLLAIFGRRLAAREMQRLEASKVVVDETRVYDRVLWFGLILFYVSVPALVVICLALAFWGLVYFGLSYYSAAGAFILAVGGAWSVLAGLWFKPELKERGLPVERATQPRLFAALDEVSSLTGVPVPARVLLQPDASVSVHESGRPIAVLRGRGTRTLQLGVAVLHQMSEDELKAILAHELGHLSHGETRLGPLLGRVIASQLIMLARLAESGGGSFSPAYWYLRWYLMTFLKITGAHSRRRELLADRTAALAYGGAALSSALQRVVENSARLERLQAVLRTVRTFELGGAPDPHAWLEAMGASDPPGLWSGGVTELIERPVDPLDTHPPIRERQSRVEGLVASREPAPAPALTLLEGLDELRPRLSQQLQDELAEDLKAAGESLPPAQDGAEPVSPTLVGALSAYHAARTREGRDPEAPRYFSWATEQLQSALGETPALVPFLVGQSEAETAADQLAVALRTLERATAIARGCGEAERVDDLERRRGELEALAKRNADYEASKPRPS